jgi:hypothetical protein
MKRYAFTAVAVLAFVTFAGALLGALRALTREPSVILSDTTCAPPCWNTIQPGVTTADEVFRILSGAEGVDPQSLSETLRGAEVVRTFWVFTRPAPDGTGFVHYRDGTVAAIVIGTYGSVHLNEMLAKLGSPSFLWNHCAVGSGSTRPESVLFWPQRGYAIALEFPSPCSDGAPRPLSPGDGVTRVIYFEPLSLEQILEGRSLFGAGSEHAASDWAPWDPSQLVP